MFRMPNAGLFMVLSLGMLSIYYLLFGFLLFRERETRTNNPALSAVVGMVCSLAVAGILFKLMYWPGSRLLLFCGFMSIAILVMPYYVYMVRYRDSNKGLYKYYMDNLLRLMITASITSLLMLIPSSAILKFQYRDDPRQAELRQRVLEDPENEQYREELWQYIDNKYDNPADTSFLKNEPPR